MAPMPPTVRLLLILVVAGALLALSPVSVEVRVRWAGEDDVDDAPPPPSEQTPHGAVKVTPPALAPSTHAVVREAITHEASEDVTPRARPSTAPAAPPPGGPPRISAFYVHFGRPRAFLHVLSTYRAAYPTETLSVVGDVGCLNFSHAARHFGAHYHDAPQQLTKKGTGGTYMALDHAKTFLRHVRLHLERSLRLRRGAEEEPFFLLLEDDVWTVRRVQSPLPFHINGWSERGVIVNVAERYIRAHNPDAPTPIPLAGSGGCVFNSSFLLSILSRPDLDAELNELYEGGTFPHYAPDYLFSSLVLRFGGTTGTFCGFAQAAAERFQKHLSHGLVEIAHDWKELYAAGDTDEGLGEEERRILGPDWRNRLT
jgi:hypothetical protein